MTAHAVTADPRVREEQFVSLQGEGPLIGSEVVFDGNRSESPPKSDYLSNSISEFARVCGEISLGVQAIRSLGQPPHASTRPTDRALQKRSLRL